MKHNKIKELLPLYIDNELTEQEKKMIQNHLENCKECQSELRQYQDNYNLLSSLKDEEVPSGFKESILRKVGEEMKNSEAQNEKKSLSLMEKLKAAFTLPVKMPAGIIALATIVLLVFLSGIPGTIFNNNNSINNDLLMREESSYQPQYFSQSLDSAPDTRMKMTEMSPQQNASLLSNTRDAQIEQKIIKRANLVIELNNIDDIDKKLINLIENYNGYISDSRNWLNQTKQKYFWFELKIPADNFNSILEQLSAKEYGEIISRSISSQDVTEEYMDLDIRLKNLLSQEDRYRQLLDIATEVEEILKIEKELNRVRTEIERLQGRKNYLDNQISFSTITVEFRQPQPISSGTPGIIRAIRNAISKMIDQFYKIIILIGTIIPYLILLLIAYFIYKSRKEK